MYIYIWHTMKAAQTLLQGYICMIKCKTSLFLKKKQLTVYAIVAKVFSFNNGVKTNCNLWCSSGSKENDSESVFVGQYRYDYNF